MATARTIQLLRRPTAVDAGVLRIVEGRDSSYYLFREIRCAIGGRGFAMHKIGLGEMYHLRVGRQTHTSCECLGFLAHQRCKHVMGVRALIARRLI